MKKVDVLIREYMRKITDDQVRFIAIRSQNLEGDRAAIANVVEDDKEMDEWLSTAKCAKDWFDMIDSVGEGANRELARRSGVDI